MNILVTGAAGFIGSHLIKRLIKNGNCNIIGIDNLERGKLEYLGSALSSIKFIEADLRNYNSTEYLFEEIDLVIHMASKVGGIGTYLAKPYEIISDNMLIDSNVLKASLKHGVKNYFYASSAHIYPKALQDTKDSPKIFEHDAYPADCELSYGWAKLVGEKQLEYACCENKDFKCAIARFIGIYGTNQDIELRSGSVIPVFSHRAICYPEISFDVWGTGEETRSYCYIDDALNCIELMIDKMNSLQMVGPLNVGKEERISISEIANIVIEISGKPIAVKYDTSKNTVIWGQWCSIEKAKQLLGWEAKTTIENGLRIVYADVETRLGKQ